MGVELVCVLKVQLRPRPWVKAAEVARAKAETEIAHRLAEVRAKAEEIEALAKLRMDATNLKAEERLIACLERGSSHFHF